MSAGEAIQAIRSEHQSVKRSEETAAKKTEAESQKELRSSANFLAEAVSIQSLTANMPVVTMNLQALAESETCCQADVRVRRSSFAQERLDAQLGRIKDKRAPRAFDAARSFFALSQALKGILKAT